MENYFDNITITSIGTNAINSPNITKVTIPNTVTTIGVSAFSGCINLTDIKIPSSVTTISDHAFSDCRSLTNITIPSSV
ncbi:leucine-rich repeat domain-containing protein [Clostridium saccharoperbutylacetonicum]|uniref:leucine-rich repeat domain-containing protein n=1 Tax=Clostridium saccharoperbutylacetonicum TaxID=36745 RepID=UPI0039E7BA46